MKYIYALLLFFISAAPALAAGPAELQYTPAQTGTYHFEVIDWHNSNAENLNISLTEPGFINWIGSIAVTLMAFVSAHVLLSSLVFFVVVSLAVVFMMTVVANEKINADISDMTTDVELSESLRKMTQDEDRKKELGSQISHLKNRISSTRSKQSNYWQGVSNFRRMNSGSSLKNIKNSDRANWQKSKKNKQIGY